MSDDGCSVWWVDTSNLGWCSTALLSDTEVARAATIGRAEDHNRFMVGATLLRLVVGRATGTEPDQVQIDRSCPRCGEPHGKPTLTGPAEGLHASTTHSGSIVGVALSRLAPVGLDVEVMTSLDYKRLLPSVYADGEPMPGSRCSFFVHWTRKESVLKASGDGLTRPMSDIVLTEQGGAAVVTNSFGHLIAASLIDFRPAAGYVGALTVLSRPPVPVTETHVTSTFADWFSERLPYVGQAALGRSKILPR